MREPESWDEDVTAVIAFGDGRGPAPTIEPLDYCPQCGMDYDEMTPLQRGQHRTDGEYVVCGCDVQDGLEYEVTGAYQKVAVPESQPVVVNMPLDPDEFYAVRRLVKDALNGEIVVDLRTFETLNSLEEKFG